MLLNEIVGCYCYFDESYYYVLGKEGGFIMWLEFGGIESHCIVYILAFIRNSYYAFRAQLNALLEESIQVSALGCYLRA